MREMTASGEALDAMLPLASVLMPPPGAGDGEEVHRDRDGDVVTAEAERVVNRGQVALGQCTLDVGGDVDAQVGFGVLQVDRRRHHAVPKREQ